MYKLFGRPPRPAGISLVEVLIALFVLVIGILPAFHVLSQGTMGTTMTRDEILAHAYATEAIDWGYAKGFDAMTAAAFTERDLPAVDGGTPIDPRFRRVLTVVERTPDRGIADWPLEYRILQARVTWTTAGIDQVFVQTGLLFRGRPR